jgi:hypothetical protein
VLTHAGEKKTQIKGRSAYYVTAPRDDQFLTVPLLILLLLKACGRCIVVGLERVFS